jgi:hypothetical protein
MMVLNDHEDTANILIRFVLLLFLSLRFNHEGFCDGHKAHRKTPRLLSSRTQAVFLRAG